MNECLRKRRYFLTVSMCIDLISIESLYFNVNGMQQCLTLFTKRNKVKKRIVFSRIHERIVI
ncbi:hypothetical protein WH47_03349 [Habropoda laboriosa]|uniref:Uncharacterized protein n=1 Tax=Habropoda laboriosa TaxID=597456 RepID=A0A0L7RBQ0_9HYME|nr:hypothetical protein WH47_03349 [Habropoda laboriosa]